MSPIRIDSWKGFQQSRSGRFTVGHGIHLGHDWRVATGRREKPDDEQRLGHRIKPVRRRRGPFVFPQYRLAEIRSGFR